MTSSKRDLLGPIYWNILHRIALTADQSTDPSISQQAWTIIQNIPAFIPCEECQKHFQDYLRTNPLQQGQSIHVWMVDFHNFVSQRLGKRPWSYEETARFYQSADSVMVPNGVVLQLCRDDTQKTLYYLMFFLGILLVVYFGMRVAKHGE